MTQEWNVPETDIVKNLHTALDAGNDGVLVTVIDVEGSAYRRPGAKMIISDGVTEVGTITAGCLEDEVHRLAQDVIETGTPRIETYDLLNDEDVWGLGIGCNGIIRVLLEPIDDTFRGVTDGYADGRTTSVVTVLSGDGIPDWSKATYRPDTDSWNIESGEIPDWLRTRVTEPATDLLDAERAETLAIDAEDRSAEVFVDSITPPPELVVLGDGHDVPPVVDLAKKSGFHVTVVSFRGGTSSEEFPRADDVLSTSPGDVADVCDFDGDTYAVVMTHNFIDDRLALDQLLHSSLEYVGLMGPRERFNEMLDAFADEGRSFTDEERARIYTPVGVNLGGGSPYQIAHSIVAEVLAVHHEREPTHLSDRDGPIHPRTTLEPDPA